MQPRIEYATVAPGAMEAMRALEAYPDQSGIEPSLIELVRLRASQINGCAYCIDMHTKEARAAGESEQRLYALSAWRVTPFFRERELVDLTMAIIAINGWNRLSVSFRSPTPGSYQPQQHPFGWTSRSGHCGADRKTSRTAGTGGPTGGCW